VTACFWSTDMILTCFRGYHHDGKVVMEPYSVIHHYVRSWFGPDLVIVLCDWGSLILFYLVENADSSNTIRFLRFAKAGRVIRVMGILRFVKFIRVLEDYIQTRLSESKRLILRVASLVFGILYLNHFVACIWYLVGTQAPSDTGLRWTSDYTADGFLDRTPGYRYTTTLHWSVSQMTLGAIEINCQNTAERICNVSCLIFGLLFGSTLVSSLSATMVEFQMMRNGIRQRMRTLRQYLRDNQVGVGVSLRVQRQVAERLSAKTTITDKDVAVLDLLTLSLRAELRFEIFTRHVTLHPLFRMWGTLDETMLRRLCNVALDFIFLRASDELFVPGVAQDEAYMVVSGKVRYTIDPDSMLVQDKVVDYVQERSWLCEASLWSYWIHVGTAEVATTAQLLVVQADGVVEVLQIRHIARDLTLAYAHQFHRCIITSTPPNASWPTDIQVPFTDYGDLVQAMEEVHQVTIGLAAVESVVARPRHKLYGKTLLNLTHEVETGKCTVMLNGDGELERVVSVVALNILNKDRRVLVQIGKHTGLEVSIGCQLPGGKQERGEFASDAAQRIMDTKLRAYADFVNFIGISRQTELKQSQEYGINTKYLRNVCNARLQDDEVQLPAGKQLAELAPEPTCSGEESIMQSQQSRGTGWVDVQVGRRFSHTLHERELVHIGGRDRGIFYAWLTMQEFEELKHMTTQQDVLKALGKMSFEVSCFQVEQNGKILVVDGVKLIGIESDDLTEVKDEEACDSGPLSDADAHAAVVEAIDSI